MKFILRNIVIKGQKIQLFDALGSNTALIIENEINSGEYDILLSGKINFQPGDVVIDIGGNIGAISILLAKKFPFLKIYAFEPVFENWKVFRRNMHLNNISNEQIKLHNFAVTGDGRLVKINTNAANNGIASIVNNPSTGSGSQIVKSVKLDWVFEQYNIAKCKAIKIDCEGAEFEIIYNFKNLKNVEYMIGEAHSFDDKKNNKRALLEYLEGHLDKNKIEFSGY